MPQICRYFQSPFPFLPPTPAFSFSTSYWKDWKGLQFYFSTFLGARDDHVTHLWPTNEYVSAVNFWGKFCCYDYQMWKAMNPSPFFSLEYRHIALNCSGHLVTKRERPQYSQRHWYCGVTDPTPVASSS